MFKNTLDFSYNRTKLQAFGFYIIHFILCVLLCGVLGGALGQDEDFQTSFKKGQIIGQYSCFIYCLILAVAITYTKKLYKNAFALILTLSAPICSMLLGALLGIIPCAILTTFKSETNITDEKNDNPEI